MTTSKPAGLLISDSDVKPGPGVVPRSPARRWRRLRNGAPAQSCLAAVGAATVSRPAPVAEQLGEDQPAGPGADEQHVRPGAQREHVQAMHGTGHRFCEHTQRCRGRGRRRGGTSPRGATTYSANPPGSVTPSARSCRQRRGAPRRQLSLHSPQVSMLSRATSRPATSPAVPGHRASTSPTISWPGIRGERGRTPRREDGTSVPHTPVTLAPASGPHRARQRGSGTSVRRTSVGRS